MWGNCALKEKKNKSKMLFYEGKSFFFKTVFVRSMPYKNVSNFELHEFFSKNVYLMQQPHKTVMLYVYKLISVFIFSALFFLHFFWNWQGEFVGQSGAS